MKKQLIGILGLTAVVSTSLGGTAVYTADGDISDKTVTSGDDVAMYHPTGGTVTVELDQNTSANIFRIGHQVGNATLSVTTPGATLTAASLEVGHSTAAAGYTGRVSQTTGTVSSADVKIGIGNVNGVYDLSGGNLTSTLGKVTVGENGTLNVSGGALTVTTATNPTASLDIDSGGLVDISGGTHSIGGRIFNSGTFRVSGDDHTASTIDINQVQGGLAGAWEFVFDATGVSTLASSSWVSFDSASLLIDGTAYTGSETSFDLVTTQDRLLGGFAGTISVLGFGTEGVDYELIQGVSGDFGTQGTVTLNLIPEPATYALLGGLLALSYVMVRRRK